MDAEGVQILLHPVSAARPRRNRGRTDCGPASAARCTHHSRYALHREDRTPAAFFSEESGRDIQKDLIEYVANFVKIAAGKRFNPHVTIGVGTETYLKKMLAEPFPSFTFSVSGASVYQLGSFGTARKELKALTLSP